MEVIAAALLSACTGAPTEAGVRHAELLKGSCDDPTSCTLTNGTGVYFEEFGDAAIGPNQLMITHFTNHPATTGPFGQPATVTVSMRGLFNNRWVQVGAPVSATYDGTAYKLLAIGERGTAPFVTLDDGGGTPFDITGEKLVGLELYVLAKQNYVLSFVSQPSSDLGPGSASKTTWSINMHWRAQSDPSSTSNSYCLRAPTTVVSRWGWPWILQLDDGVVFQQGIDVDPLTGSVTPNSSDVTLSCRYGAPAVAYWWGYDYSDPGISLNYFQAAIHMKRASYCGDSGFHTLPNTQITVQDNLGIEGAPQPGPVGLQFPAVEAYWGVNGAVCYKQPRRPDLQANGIQPFGGTCYTHQVPSCDSPAYQDIEDAMSKGTQMLVNGVVWPQ
jgi:hypothetical protein